jgi:hypothetical protein
MTSASHSFTEAPLYYHSYLGLDKLLTAQNLMSAHGPVAEADREKDPATVAAAAAGCPHAAAALSSSSSSSSSPSSSAPASSSSEPEGPNFAALEAKNRTGAHDEHLFITIHQAFELWFKQVLWELGDARKLLNCEYVPERSVGTVISRLTRVVEIFRLLVEQFTILETMTPMGFLEFRDYLFPASGFQSLQWRTIEQGLGLVAEARVSYGQRRWGLGFWVSLGGVGGASVVMRNYGDRTSPPPPPPPHLTHTTPTTPPPQ